MPRDLLAEQNEPRDLLADYQPPQDNNELSFRQGVKPDFIDNVFSFFRDPQKEKARATLALVDSEALGINPHTAYNAKKGIDKYYDIDPTRKKAKEDKLQRIKAFNDMGGEEEEWHTLFLRNVQKLRYHMMDAAGNWIRMFEESPEAAFAMTGATPSEEDLQTFKLATEAIEKKKVRTLGDDIAGAAKEKIKSLTPATAPDSWKDTVHMAGDSVMTNLVWLIPGFKYGKAASLTGMGWQATGQTYGEQREGGSDPGTAFAAATIGGMSEVLSEFIPVGIYLKPKASFIRSLVAAEFSEIPTEMANQVVQDVVDKVTIRPDMTIEDMIDNLTQTIQVTALSTLALSGMSYSANKAIGKSTQGTEHADSFNQAKNRALRDGKAPQEAIKEGIEAIKSTPEGQTFVDQKEAEIKQAAKDYKPTENKTPFIIGVNDENGEVTSFTMADPISGQTFDVPAIDKSGDKEGATVKFIPDPKVINEALSRIREPEEIDTKIDKIIEGNEDIDKVVNQIFGEDVPDFESEEDTTTPEKTEPAANVEPLITEARKYKTAEEFVNSQLAKQNESANIDSMTPKKGTADIPAKDKLQAEAEKYNDTSKIIARPVKDVGLKFGDELPEDVYLHGSKRTEGDIDNFSVSTSPGGTLYLTKRWETAEIFSHNVGKNESFIKAVELNQSADIIDLSKGADRKRLADLLYDEADKHEFTKEKFADDFKNIDFHEAGLSDDLKYGEILYDENIGAIKDNFGNIDVINDYAIKTYNPKLLPNPSRPPEVGGQSVKDLTSIWNKAQEGKAGPIEKVEPAANVDPLITEARKYKTAEEFVNSRPIFEHETNAEFDKFDLSKAGSGQGEAWLGKGIYLQEKGSFKLEKYGNKKIESGLTPEANIFEIKDTPNGKYRDNFVEYAVNNNIGSARALAEQRIKDGLSLDNLLPRDILRNNPNAVEQLKKAGFDGLLEDGELVVYNPDVLKTKADLTSIWNKAQVTPLNNAKSGESFANKLFGKAFNTLRNEDGSIVLKDNEGKDLAIVHNLSINNLRHAIKMGGLAVPSTAVINVKKSKFDSFGEITLIASKERLGPGGSQKYFNADVYSPRYPSVSYFLTENSRKSLDKWLDPLWREIPRAKNEQGGITSHYTFIEEIKEKGIDVAFEHGDALLYYAFLKESGMLPDGVDRSWDGKTKLRETVEAIGKDKYNQWYQNKIKELKLEADEKIFNGYTYAGNRRYLKHDLDTVVKLLKKELRDGEGFNYGAPSVRAKSAKQYKSIKQIKDDRHKIVSPDEMEALKEKTNDEFIALANQAIPYLKYNENSFGALDRFSEHIKEAIETHNFNRVFGENSEYYNPGVDIKAIIDYVNKLRNMPTEYFEGKIQRAVGLTEFDRAIVPDNTPDDIIQWLNSHGIKADKYINGDIESRRMAVEKAATEGNAGGTLLFTGLDITQTLDVLRGLKDNIQEAMPHLEALGRNIYESGKVKFNEWSASMKETLGDLWKSFKDAMNQVYEFTKRKLSEERGSISNRDAVNADPMFEIAKYIKERGGLNYDSLIVDWGKEDVGILMKKRPGVVRKDGALKLDEVAQEWDTNDNDLMMDLLSNKSKKDVISKVSSKAEEEYLKEIYRNEQVSREEFTRAVNKARIAFKEGNAAELKKLRNSIKWMVKRKETLKNVRDYFGLTDTEMSKISRKNPLLMDEADFAQYLKDVNLKAIDLRDNKWAKIELMNLVEQKRLQKVDNYRRALELPSIDKMTTDQLRQFAKLLEPFQNDDIFLTQRELETVDKTDLKGIKTWREARERLAKEAGVPIEELAKVKVAWNENFKWDSSLREQDPFFDLLVTKMNESMMGAEMKVHNVETMIYDLAKKAEKSRKRGIVERMIPQDELIFQYLEAPQAEKNAVAQQMTPEQLRMAHFMNQYFSNALNYLIAIKTVEHGRQNYITHIRKSFMENMRDKGIKEAITGLFTAYQEDQIGFNILDDDTGNILPLEKFFQFSLHRTGELDPTKNVVRAFMTYVAMFEKKKAFDAIIPKLDIYTQSLTPVKYTPRGLEFDRSLKTFVNKWINNKKGRKISYDSAIRQGGVLDLGIRALRTITTMIDLGFYVPAQAINFMGEQITTMVPLGYKEYAKSIALMRTDKGKRILKKYEFFTERSLWEEFTAPGKEIQQRLMDGMFGLFHISTVAANKQFLLASMTKEEWANEELSPERLAKIKLDMGRFRAIPGANSLVGSTSIGGSAMQYKAWAVGPTRTLIKDITTMAGNLKKKEYGEAFTSEEAREIYRIVGTTMAVIAVTSLAGDDDDDSFIGKMKTRAKREVFTLTQGMDPTFWLSWRSLSYLTQLGTALKNLLFLEEYETKEGLKGVNQLKKAVTPGMIRALPDEEE